MNNKKLIIIVLLLIFIVLSIYNFFFCGVKKSTYLVNIFNEIENKETYRKYNGLLDEANKTLDKTSFAKLIIKINNLEKSKYKDMLIEKINLIDSYFKEYEKKKELLNKNPDKSVGIVINKPDVKVVESIRGNISAYTPYCGGGCSGYTASGRFIGDNIFYEDKDFGTLRIVAGDYPFGTIVRIKGLYYFNEDIYAIVLDRGGIVGRNKPVLFDLLFFNEGNANDFGVQKNIQCEILRVGY